MDTPPSSPPAHQTTPIPKDRITPALPITATQPTHTDTVPNSPDLPSFSHAPKLGDSLRPRQTRSMAKRSNHQADLNNQNSEPLRLRPSPNSDTASKLQQARMLMEEIYHSPGIDKTEAGSALKTIDNIRRSCGYPSLGSSRDP